MSSYMITTIKHQLKCGYAQQLKVYNYAESLYISHLWNLVTASFRLISSQSTTHSSPHSQRPPQMRPAKRYHLLLIKLIIHVHNHHLRFLWPERQTIQSYISIINCIYIFAVVPFTAAKSLSLNTRTISFPTTAADKFPTVSQTQLLHACTIKATGRPTLPR